MRCQAFCAHCVYVKFRNCFYWALMTYIKWIDARGCNAEWTWQKDLILHPCLCESLGWVIHEDEHAIVLAPHQSMRDADEEEPQYCGEMVIPKVAILVRVKVEPMVDTHGE